MLSKIIFCIGYRQPVQAIEKLKSRTEKEGRSIAILFTQEDKALCLPNSKRENTLYAADNKKALEALKANGEYVVAFWHEENGGQDLSGASYAVSHVEELTWSDFERAWLRAKGEPWEITETDRCLIREMTVEDVEEFYEIYREPSVTRYMEGLFENPEEEREYTRKYIRTIYGLYGFGLWSIVHKESKKVIGRAGLSFRDGFDIPELGFVIAVPFQRKGYAYEACLAILDYGRKELGFDKVQAFVKKENEASVRLCGKLGFHREKEVEIRGERYERYINNI